MRDLLLDFEEPNAYSSSHTGSRYDYPYAFRLDRVGCTGTDSVQNITSRLNHVIRNNCDALPRVLIAWSQKATRVPNVQGADPIGAPLIVGSSIMRSLLKAMISVFDYDQIVNYLVSAESAKAVSRTVWRITQSADGLIHTHHNIALPKFRVVKDSCGEEVGKSITISASSQLFNTGTCKFFGAPAAYTTSLTILQDAQKRGLDTVTKVSHALAVTGYDEVATLFGSDPIDGGYRTVGPQLNIPYVVGDEPPPETP